MDFIFQVTAYGPAEAIAAFSAAMPNQPYSMPADNVYLMPFAADAPDEYTIDDLLAWLCCNSEWQTNPSTVLLAIPGLRLFVDIRRGDNDDLIAQWLVEDGVVDNA